MPASPQQRMVARPARRNKGEREIPTESRLGQASLRPVAAAQQIPPHVGQHVGDLLQQPVGLLQAAGGIGAASRLAVSVLPLVVARRKRRQTPSGSPKSLSGAPRLRLPRAMPRWKNCASRPGCWNRSSNNSATWSSQPPSSQFCVGHTLGMPEGFMAIDCM